MAKRNSLGTARGTRRRPSRGSGRTHPDDAPRQTERTLLLADHARSTVVGPFACPRETRTKY
jgi:hypothetical protein